MNWTPFILFLVTGFAAGYAQRAYFSGLVAAGSPLRTDEKFANEIRGEPRRLPRIVATEVRSRLEALATPQQVKRLERQRRIALLSIAISVTCFLWWVWLK